jgi:baculoviral IAP repeat-containing protein 2/3
MVQCAWCYGKLQGWEQGDNPLKEHARHFASCPKFGDRKAVNASSLVNVHHTQGDSSQNDLSEDDLGILTVRPCNPQFAIEASRLESFKGNWPANLAQTPDHLSASGFFYVGYSDNVKCFFCDGGLCNWEADDEPWTEHARWFPDCGFLKQVKGSKFIQKVRDIGVNGGPVTSGDEAPRRTTPSVTGNHAAAGTSNSSPSRSLTMDQKREVRAAMSSPSVVKALETGIPKEAIEMAIKDRLLAGNGHFRDDESLIEASLLANDQLMAQSSSSAAMDVRTSEGPSDNKKQKKQRKNKESPPLDQMEEDEKPPFSPEVPMTLDPCCSNETNSNGADAKSLEEENFKLKEQRLCKICMDEEVSIVLLPCGHLVSCVKCAPALRNCPICRNGIKGTVRTFMA